MSPQGSRTIFELPLAEVRGSVVDLTPYATPEHFRLVDCKRYTQDNILSISELDTFPNVPYCAISYVWRGITVDPDVHDHDDVFTVKGAEDGDPIGIDALYHACKVACKDDVQYLWVDRLCIMQTNRNDKAWQITHMSDLYRSTQICIILPGGLRRLVGLLDETSWISRAWTLQESLLPKRGLVLYEWKRPKVVAWGTAAGNFVPEVVEPFQSAVSNLPSLLLSAIAPPYFFELEGGERFKPEVKIFGDTQRKAVGSLAVACSDIGGDEAKTQAIWYSALMRTSSRPVDMVFSIMGLFGVTLDTKAFGRDDRLGATIALAREILRKGGKPEWFGGTLPLPPCKEFNIFPPFPQTAVTGGATLLTPEGIQPISMLVDRPYGTMKAIPAMTAIDDAGNATIVGPATLVTTIDFTTKNHLMHTEKGKYPCLTHLYKDLLWADEIATAEPVERSEIITRNDGTNTSKYATITRYPTSNHGEASFPRLYAIDLGEVEHYRDAAFGMFRMQLEGRGMLVEEWAPGMFHRIGWFEYDIAGSPFSGAKSETLVIGSPVARNMM